MSTVIFLKLYRQITLLTYQSPARTFNSVWPLGRTTSRKRILRCHCSRTDFRVCIQCPKNRHHRSRGCVSRIRYLRVDNLGFDKRTCTARALPHKLWQRSSATSTTASASGQHGTGSRDLLIASSLRQNTEGQRQLGDATDLSSLLGDTGSRTCKRPQAYPSILCLPRQQ